MPDWYVRKPNKAMQLHASAIAGIWISVLFIRGRQASGAAACVIETQRLYHQRKRR
jgi:hypothetical protein